MTYAIDLWIYNTWVEIIRTEMYNENIFFACAQHNPDVEFLLITLLRQGEIWQFCHRTHYDYWLLATCILLTSLYK
jgi:hypothetical protein